MPRRDRDERPPVELWQPDAPEGPPPQRVEVGAATSPSRRKALVGAAAAVALLGAGLVLGGGGDEDPEDDEPKAQEASETTRRARPTTTREATTTTREFFGPVLPEPVGAGLLLLGGEGKAVWLDLDTGERLEVDLPSFIDVFSVVAVRGGVVAGDHDGVIFVAVPGGQTTEVADTSIPYVMEGSEDSIWILRREMSGSSTASLVALDGQVLREGVSAADAVGRGTQQGLPVSRGGWSYLATEDGLTPLGVGQVVASSADAVVVHACRADGSCELVLHDLAAGDVVPLGDIDQDASGFEAHLSPDGQLLLLQYWGGRSNPREVRDRAGQIRWRHDSSGWVGSPPAWLPAGRGLILPGGGAYGAGGSGQFVWFADGVDADPQPIRAMVGTNYERMLLINR